MAERGTVAVLGAGGTMGLPIARNLLRAGFEVRAWNRTRSKAEPLEHDGARVCDAPEHAVEGATVLLTILSDVEAVTGSTRDVLPSLHGDCVWLQMSTIGEAATEQCIELAREHGATFVDGPVLGTKRPAEEAKLVVLASGPQELQSRLEPVFAAIAAKTMWVGPAGAGTRLKIAINSWVLTVVEGGAETIALTEGLGLDPGLVLEALEGGALDLPYLRMKAKTIAERNFEPSFRLALAAKDASLIEESAQRHDLDLPMFAAISQRLAEGAREHPDEDFSATYLTSAPAGA